MEILWLSDWSRTIPRLNISTQENNVTKIENTLAKGQMKVLDTEEGFKGSKNKVEMAENVIRSEHTGRDDFNMTCKVLEREIETLCYEVAMKNQNFLAPYYGLRRENAFCEGVPICSFGFCVLTQKGSQKDFHLTGSVKNKLLL